MEIVAGVAVFMGFGYLICIAARAVDNAYSFSRAILRIGGTVALGRLIDFLLTLLSSGAFRRLPRTNRLVLLLLLAISIAEGLLRAAKSLLEDISLIESASSAIHELCDKAKSLAAEAGEFVDDKWSDVADFAEDQFHRK